MKVVMAGHLGYDREVNGLFHFSGFSELRDTWSIVFSVGQWRNCIPCGRNSINKDMGAKHDFKGSKSLISKRRVHRGLK